jgi:hypothetical protein
MNNHLLFVTTTTIKQRKKNNKKEIRTCLVGKKEKLNSFCDAVKATPSNLSVAFSMTHVPINLDETPNKKIAT